MLIGSGYNTPADIWSTACMVSGVIRGFQLFVRSVGRTRVRRALRAAGSPAAPDGNPSQLFGQLADRWTPYSVPKLLLFCFLATCSFLSERQFCCTALADFECDCTWSLCFVEKRGNCAILKTKYFYIKKPFCYMQHCVTDVFSINSHFNQLHPLRVWNHFIIWVMLKWGWSCSCRSWWM